MQTSQKQKAKRKLFHIRRHEDMLKVFVEVLKTNAMDYLNSFVF